MNALKVITNEQYISFCETLQRDVSFCQLYDFVSS